MKIKNNYLAIGLLAATLPAVSLAQSVGPSAGDREFNLSGTGTSDKKFDDSNFGMSASMGWYSTEQIVWGIRQSVNFTDVDGGDFSDNYWNGSTRGYIDYQFGTGAARPFVGASLGGVYGDGVKETGIAGLELGLKYYVLDNTYILGRAEYQFFFTDSDEAENNLDDGAWAYVFGIGFNF